MNKVEGMEKMMINSLKVSKNENLLKSSLSILTENELVKNEGEIDNQDNQNNIKEQIDNSENMIKKVTYLMMKPKFSNNSVKDFQDELNENIINNQDNKEHTDNTTPLFLKENTLNNNFNIPEKFIQIKSIFLGCNISAIEESKEKSCKSLNSKYNSPINSIDTMKSNEKKKSCFTDYTGDRTIDYSSAEGDLSPSTLIGSNIVRKFYLPFYNFNIVKKYFIYQLKKSFLQTKKFIINTGIHGQINNENNPPIKSNNKNLNYHEIFSNYSQISNTTVNSYNKYDDQNIQINHYVIMKNQKLGKGGFSKVYLCINLNDKLEYAVKITGKKVRANALRTKYDFVKDEVNILKRLCSKYIVKTYEIMEMKHECLIFMELMKNNSLFSKVNKLEDSKIWNYFRNLICGVEHCHEVAKIVHRDININNLLISDNDILKISDFGVSMIIDESDLIPVNSGPTTYTPPEKKYNQITHYNGKPADIWACGVALFHMVYKRQLFKNSESLELQDYTITLPDDPENKVDTNLKELILTLLQVDPVCRYVLHDLKKNAWITKNGEFPLPDIYEEALEYVYSLTTKEIRGINEEKVYVYDDNISKCESSPINGN